jgi:hypothetical protein
MNVLKTAEEWKNRTCHRDKTPCIVSSCSMFCWSNYYMAVCPKCGARFTDSKVQFKHCDNNFTGIPLGACAEVFNHAK